MIIRWLFSKYSALFSFHSRCFSAPFVRDYLLARCCLYFQCKRSNAFSIFISLSHLTFSQTFPWKTTTEIEHGTKTLRFICTLHKSNTNSELMLESVQSEMTLLLFTFTANIQMINVTLTTKKKKKACYPKAKSSHYFTLKPSFAFMKKCFRCWYCLL